MASSRQRKSAIDKIEAVRNWLAFAVVSAFIGAMAVFTFVTIPTANKDIITYMVGQLSGMALTTLGFYFVNKVGADALEAKRADNTGKMADAVVAAANSPGPNANEAKQQGAEEVATAAADKKNEIAGEQP
jgi:hypothetical protein